MSSPVTGVTPEGFASGEFGANEWLVDEMYERYRVDKHSVDKSWWPILENYQPGASAPLAAEPAASSTATRAVTAPVTAWAHTLVMLLRILGYQASCYSTQRAAA